MKLTKTALLTTGLLSLFLVGQTAIADQAPNEVRVFKNMDVPAQYPAVNPDQKPRVNYSILNSDLEETNEWDELFPESES